MKKGLWSWIIAFAIIIGLFIRGIVLDDIGWMLLMGSLILIFGIAGLIRLAGFLIKNRKKS
jgi:hypothetical protein